jgi:hypothetical protein
MAAIELSNLRLIATLTNHESIMTIYRLGAFGVGIGGVHMLIQLITQ